MNSRTGERAHMPASQRAKQFLPFDAVAGLRQALRMKEHEMGLITRRDLSEEMAEDINGTLAALRPGDHVSVMYFKEAEAAPVKIRRDGFDEEIEEGERPEAEGEMILITGKIIGMSRESRTVTVAPDDDSRDIHGLALDAVIKIDDIASIDLFAEEL